MQRSTTKVSRTTRREFLALTLAGLGSTLVGAGCGKDTTTSPGVGGVRLPVTVLDLPQLLESYFAPADFADAREMGGLFLADYEAGDAALSAELTPTVERVATLDTFGEAVDSLEAAVTEDFDADRMRELLGWKVSETELHLSVLANLLA